MYTPLWLPPVAAGRSIMSFPFQPSTIVSEHFNCFCLLHLHYWGYCQLSGDIIGYSPLSILIDKQNVRERSIISEFKIEWLQLASRLAFSKMMAVVALICNANAPFWWWDILNPDPRIISFHKDWSCCVRRFIKDKSTTREGKKKWRREFICQSKLNHALFWKLLKGRYFEVEGGSQYSPWSARDDDDRTAAW